MPQLVCRRVAQRSEAILLQAVRRSVVDKRSTKKGASKTKEEKEMNQKGKGATASGARKRKGTKRCPQL
jgi:hypothetical protein